MSTSFFLTSDVSKAESSYVVLTCPYADVSKAAIPYVDLTFPYVDVSKAAQEPLCRPYVSLRRRKQSSPGALTSSLRFLTSNVSKKVLEL